MEIKHIDIKEFREKGYLQEVNRRFFHPIGLALSVNIDEEGNEVLGGVWDYRNDPEGILFHDPESINVYEEMKKKEEFIDSEQKRFAKYRRKLCGDSIQVIKKPE